MYREVKMFRSRSLVGVLPLPTLLALVAAISCGDASTNINGPPPPPPPGGESYRIEYATYLGGNAFDEAREPVLMNGGRLLFGARARSSNMPTTSGAFQRNFSGGAGDSYLAILSADGSRLEAATYFGGSGMERPPYGIAIASNGDIVFTSGTTSPDIPTTAGAYRPSLHNPVPSPGGDGYVCRISSDLTALRWCTYTGGGWPRGGLMVDGQDNVLVVGRVTGSNFATTPGVVQRAARGFDDGFVMKLNSSGTDAIFSTRLGGNGSEVGEVALSIRRRTDGSLSIIGNSRSSDFPTTPGAAQPVSSGPSDAFLAVLDPTASSLLYSTLLSGSSSDGSEHRHLVLPDGTALSTGVTRSTDLPARVGSFRGSVDGFLARLRPDGSAFDYVRYLGGSGTEQLLGPVTDSHGNLIVFGSTSSTDLPTTENAIQRSYAGGPTDGVLYIFGPDGSTVEMLTYLGWSGEELIRGIAVGPADELYLVGRTDSNDLPVTSGALQRSHATDADAFVIKLVRTDN